MSKRRDSYTSSAVIALLIICGLVVITLLIFIFSKQKISSFEPDFGGLIGGSLGGIGTLIAVILTLKANHAAAQTDRKANIKPLLNIWHRNGADIKRNLDSQCDVYDWVINLQDACIEKKTKFEAFFNTQSNAHPFIRQLVIQNIGLGSAININIEVSWNTFRLSLYEPFHLEVGQMTLRNFVIPNVYSTDVFSGLYTICFKFSDLLGNDYSQEIEFPIVIDQSVSCGLNLGDYIRTKIAIDL